MPLSDLLPDHAAVLRRRWPLLVVPGVVGAVVVAVALLAGPRTWTSTASLYLAPGTGASDSLVAQRLASYSAMVTSPVLQQAVATDLGTPGGASAVAGGVAVSVEPDTLLLTITASGTSSAGATSLAGSTTSELVSLVRKLEGSSTDPASTLVVSQPATPGVLPTASESAGRVVLGGLGGLVAGTVLALAVDAVARHRRTRADARGAALAGPAHRPGPRSRSWPAAVVGTWQAHREARGRTDGGTVPAAASGSAPAVAAVREVLLRIPPTPPPAGPPTGPRTRPRTGPPTGPRTGPPATTRTGP